MKIKYMTVVVSITILCLLAVMSLSACGGGQNEEPEAEPTPVETPSPTPPPPTPPPSPTPLVLVPYDGVVEHLFVHEVIAYPELAFDGGSGQKGMDDYMITAYEFTKILESLHKNNYILVDINDVWMEFTNENGQQRMRLNTLMLPEGKKPLILSFDDLSFYEYMVGEGFMERYVVGSDGEIWAEGYDPNGERIVSQDFAVITILDKFVRENPDFSLDGVKGCIALTGYEGILGYRTQTSNNDNSDEFRLNRMKEIARVEPVVQRLKETGWYFATHSYGHIRNSTASLDSIKADALRWLSEVGSIVGETHVYIYAHGERLDGCDWRCTAACGPGFRFWVEELGFRLFASVGSDPFTTIKTDVPAVVMDRMNIDGITLRRARDRFLRFYDAKEVFDPQRPSEYEVLWGDDEDGDD